VLEGMDVELLLVGFILVFLAFLYANKKNFEPFDGNVPTTNQTSAIAQDTSASTTTNPQTALAQPKDVLALMETIKNFKLLYNAQDPKTLNLDPQSLSQTQYFYMQADNLTNQLQAGLANSDAVSLSFDDTVQLRNAYQCSIDILRGKSEILPPTQQGAAPNGLTLDMLQKLQSRVQAESLRLANLRSSAPTMVARIADLDKLAANLGDIISSVQRGETKLADINISPDDANRFLSTLGTGQNAPVPDVTVGGGSTKSMTIGPHGIQSPPGFPPMGSVQGILDLARNLKWGVTIQLESDPSVKLSQDILEKIDTIEKSISKHIVSETPVPAEKFALYKQQLSVLQNLTKDKKPDAMSVLMGPPKPVLQPRDDITQAYVPTQQELMAAQGMTGGPAAGSTSAGIGSGDYNMTDDNIQHRASAASFDDSIVGGLDYKTRALEMCRQIQAADLGDPTNFGCIKNPDEVSASYSWKGNYQMVCSRLGDTWGHWYPQMFGCPKVDPTAKYMREA